MNNAFGEIRWYFFEQLHDFQIFAKGKPTNFHLVDPIDVKIWKELHIVIDMRLVALESFVADEFGTEELPHSSYKARIIEVYLQESLLLGMIPVEVEFVFNLGLENYVFVCFECLLVHALYL